MIKEVLMDKKFTIRLAPKDGESFSSYLLRVCERNKVNINDFLNSQNNYYKKFDLRNSHHLDIFPSKFINLHDISRLVGASDRLLLNCTLYSLLHYFCSKTYFTKLKGQNDTLLKYFFNIKQRYYCTHCLKNDIYYKLFWQFKDINICNIHLNPLTSFCSNCNKEQPYIHKKLVQASCFYCNQSLITQSNNPKKLHKLETQEKLWYFEQLCKIQESFLFGNFQIPDFRHKIIKFLYLCNKTAETFNIKNLELISRDYKYKLINNLINNSMVSSFDISVSLLLKVLRIRNKTIDDFQNISVPYAFLESLAEYIEKNKSLKCLTPWCTEYNSSNLLYKVKKIRSKTHNNLHLCLGCCIKFGNNKKTNNWEEYGDLISIAYEQVRPLINSKFSLIEISRKARISRYKVNKMVSYLARYRLINENSQDKFFPKNNKSFDYAYLLSIANIKEVDTIRMCKQHYKISERDMYYYYFDPKVQKSIYC